MFNKRMKNIKKNVHWLQIGISTWKLILNMILFYIDSYGRHKGILSVLNIEMKNG